LVEVEDGAVYVDQDGGVSRIDEQGRSTFLGQGDPVQGVVGSVDGSRIAWREPTTGDLVVHDLARDEEVGRVGGTGLEPVAIDGDRLFYNSLSGSFVVVLPDGEPQLVERLPLLDVRAGTLLFQTDAAHLRL
ncbi:hypothetical protein, partial [Raoultella terrigena]|uniref:hypothetical protein n=1 Tax=Raoultella terrigena TaxID=577 RepID=UPI00132FE952